MKHFPIIIQLANGLTREPESFSDSILAELK